MEDLEVIRGAGIGAFLRGFESWGVESVNLIQSGCVRCRPGRELGVEAELGPSEDDMRQIQRL